MSRNGDIAMKHATRLLAGLGIALAALGAPSLDSTAFAQGTPQTVTLMRVDLTTLATGYRASKLLGGSVQNEAQEVIGTVDDLIITSGGQVPFAVLSVGGFLGIDKRYVVVPANSLSVVDKHLLLHGATKDSLKALPSFQYTY
jgi:hypothetical protein